MSIESDFYTALKAICPRVFPDFAPVSTTRPYVTYQAIGGEVINPIGNDVPNKRNVVMQVNVWSNTRLEANTISQAIESALRTSSAFVARPQSAAIDDFDADLPVYSSIQDFTIWGNR